MREFRQIWTPTIIVALATSFVWGLGLYGLYDDYTNIYAYIIIFFSVVIIIYGYTERLIISQNQVSMKRYFRTIWKLDKADCGARVQKVGEPALLKGMAFYNLTTEKQVGFIITGNYSKEDVMEIKHLLADNILE